MFIQRADYTFHDELNILFHNFWGNNGLVMYVVTYKVVIIELSNIVFFSFFEQSK